MSRSVSLDILKIFMSFFVVLLHMKFLMNNDPEVGQYFTNGIFRVAVPIFLVINGFFLYSTFQRQNFAKTLKSLFKVYALWMVIYSYFWLRDTNTLNFFITLSFGYHILWYFPALILSAIMLYLFRDLKTKKIIIMSIVFYFLGYIIQVILYKGILLGDSDNMLLKIILYRNFIFDCFPLISAGFLMKKHNMADLINKKTNLLLVIISLSMLIIEVYVNGAFYGTSYQADIMIFTPLLAICIFTYTTKLQFTSKIESKLLSQFATSIFLVHVLCINISRKIFDKINYHNDYAFYLSVLLISVVFSMCIVIVKSKYKNLPIIP